MRQEESTHEYLERSELIWVKRRREEEVNLCLMVDSIEYTSNNSDKEVDFIDLHSIIKHIMSYFLIPLKFQKHLKL